MSATLELAFLLLGLLQKYAPAGSKAVSQFQAVLDAARDEKREVTNAELTRLRVETQGEVDKWNAESEAAPKSVSE